MRQTNTPSLSTNFTFFPYFSFCLPFYSCSLNDYHTLCHPLTVSPLRFRVSFGSTISFSSTSSSHSFPPPPRYHPLLCLSLSSRSSYSFTSIFLAMLRQVQSKRYIWRPLSSSLSHLSRSYLHICNHQPTLPQPKALNAMA